MSMKKKTRRTKWEQVWEGEQPDFPTWAGNWPERIAGKFLESTDEIARLDIRQDESDQFYRFQQWCLIHGFFTASVCPHMNYELRQAKVYRYALKALDWKNQFQPEHTKVFKVSAEGAANKFAEKQRRHGYFVRVLSANDLMWEMDHYDNNYFRSLHLPKIDAGWHVQVWKYGQYLQYIAICFTLAEMLSHLESFHSEVAADSMKIATQQPKGAAKHQSQSQKRIEAQRKLYLAISAEPKYKNYKKSEKLKIIYDNNRSRRGWKMSSLEHHTVNLP